MNRIEIDIDQEPGLSEDVIGMRSGLICTIALLVTLLEERGVLELGIYKSSLRAALLHLRGSHSSPEAGVLVDFVKTLDDTDSRPLRS